jgi:signal transduction histidine kinase
VTAGLTPVFRSWISWAAFGAVVSVGVLSWLGYRAITEWQRSAELVAERNATTSADLLLTAVTRDMRGVQRTVLSALLLEESRYGATLNLNDVASAFARYPYPEAFFVARIGADESPITFYMRTNRQASWLPAASPNIPFPVVMTTQPSTGRQLIERVATDVRKRKTFSAFDVQLGRVNCQVIALLAYPETSGLRKVDVRGFVVNLDWVRQSYFQDLTSQIARMRVADPGLRLAVMDTAGAVHAGGRPPAEVTASTTRHFPLLFFDPAMVDLDPPSDLTTEWWLASAAVIDRRSINAARTGARVSLFIVAISALALAGALGLGATALQARSRLTEARTEFVAAVTHELKTPMATIQAIGESFARRAHIDETTRREYGQIVLNEAKRLTRLVDNLLAYARISDVTDGYSFETVSLDTLVGQALDEFRFRLESDQFEVSVDVAPHLRVRADVIALSLALRNVIDNAIRYSDERRRLSLQARALAAETLLEVSDAGIGIPLEELDKVTQKFFRGARAPSGGTGLGLPIAKRIVSDHGGRLLIRSEPNIGTTVTFAFATKPGDSGDTHPDC